jgi:hypothetical protein
MRLKLKGKMHHCGCAISCRRRDIGLWRPGEWLNNPTFYLWRPVFFSRLGLLRCNVIEWH